jgi:hypothetical protein
VLEGRGRHTPAPGRGPPVRITRRNARGSRRIIAPVDTTLRGQIWLAAAAQGGLTAALIGIQMAPWWIRHRTSHRRRRVTGTTQHRSRGAGAHDQGPDSCRDAQPRLRTHHGGSGSRQLLPTPVRVSADPHHRLWVSGLREFDNFRLAAAHFSGRTGASARGNFFTNKHLPGYAPATISMAPALLLLARGALSTCGSAAAVCGTPRASTRGPLERGQSSKKSGAIRDFKLVFRPCAFGRKRRDRNR